MLDKIERLKSSCLSNSLRVLKTVYKRFEIFSWRQWFSLNTAANAFETKSFYNPQPKQIQHSWTEIDYLFFIFPVSWATVCFGVWEIPWHLGPTFPWFTLYVSQIVQSYGQACQRLRARKTRLRVNETIRHNGKTQCSLSLHVLVAVIKWFVMFEHWLMCNTCYVLVWLMSKPKGAYSEMHCFALLLA